MKDHQAIRVSKLLKLTDVGIKPDEINWARVKMPNTRWVSIIHRRKTAGVFYGNQSSSSANSSMSSSSGSTSSQKDWTQKFKHDRQSYKENRSGHYGPQAQQHLPVPQPAYSTPVKTRPLQQLPQQQKQTPIESSSPPAPPSSTGSVSPYTIQSSSSGIGTPSPHALSRKPSSLSNTSSSSSSSSIVNTPDYLELSRVKHSASSFDLRTPQYSHHSIPPNVYKHKPMDGGPKEYYSPYDCHRSPWSLVQPHQHHLHHQQRKLQKTTLDDSYLGFSSMMPACIENVITIIDYVKGHVINCQTSLDTNSAQISPRLEVIGVSNHSWLAFYSIETNDCLGTLQLPAQTRYWCWATGETVAIVGEHEIYHWRIDVEQSRKLNKSAISHPRPMFQLDDSIKDNQITGYQVDPVFGSWCALTSLYVDENGEIGGRVQIYSQAYGQSQCFDAHSATFAAYHFDDSDRESTLLIAAGRERDGSWKLHIIELGPIPTGNRNHRAKTITLTLHKRQQRRDSQESKSSSKDSSSSSSSPPGLFDDVPTNIACDARLGVIYVLSKYGSFYVCDLETGVALHYEKLGPSFTHDSAMFAFAYDASSQTLIAITRAGRVVAIDINFEQLIADTKAGGKQTINAKVIERINRRLEHNGRRKRKEEENNLTKKASSPETSNAEHSKTDDITSSLSSCSLESSLVERTLTPEERTKPSLSHIEALDELATAFHQQHLQVINPKEDSIDFALLSRELSVDDAEEITRL